MTFVRFFVCCLIMFLTNCVAPCESYYDGMEAYYCQTNESQSYKDLYKITSISPVNIDRSTKITTISIDLPILARLQPDQSSIVTLTSELRPQEVLAKKDVKTQPNFMPLQFELLATDLPAKILSPGRARLRVQFELRNAPGTHNYSALPATDAEEIWLSLPVPVRGSSNNLSTPSEIKALTIAAQDHSVFVVITGMSGTVQPTRYTYNKDANPSIVLDSTFSTNNISMKAQTRFASISDGIGGVGIRIDGGGIDYNSLFLCATAPVNKCDYIDFPSPAASITGIVKFLPGSTAAGGKVAFLRPPRQLDIFQYQNPPMPAMKSVTPISSLSLTKDADLIEVLPKYANKEDALLLVYSDGTLDIFGDIYTSTSTPKSLDPPAWLATNFSRLIGSKQKIVWMASADLNDDTIEDLIYTLDSQPQTVLVALANSEGSYQKVENFFGLKTSGGGVAPFSLPALPLTLALGDIDGDQDMDLIPVPPSGNQTPIYINEIPH